MVVSVGSITWLEFLMLWCSYAPMLPELYSNHHKWSFLVSSAAPSTFRWIDLSPLPSYQCGIHCILFFIWMLLYIWIVLLIFLMSMSFNLWEDISYLHHFFALQSRKVYLLNLIAFSQHLLKRHHLLIKPVYVLCTELGWASIPLVVESYGAWGKEAWQCFFFFRD